MRRIDFCLSRNYLELFMREFYESEPENHENLEAISQNGNEIMTIKLRRQI